MTDLRTEEPQSRQCLFTRKSEGNIYDQQLKQRRVLLNPSIECKGPIIGSEGLRRGMLNLSTTAILSHIILCCGGNPVHCQMFSSILGLGPRIASSTHLVVTPEVCRHCQIPQRGKRSGAKPLWLGTSWAKAI